jgi:hypothetical protein
MLSMFSGVLLYGCIACTAPAPALADRGPVQNGVVELVRHRRNHFVSTRAAMRYCRRRYGNRVTRAFESRTTWRCYYLSRRRR